MKKIKLSNLGWIISGILFLVLAFKIGQDNRKKEEIKVNNIQTEVSVTPTETVIPTLSPELISVIKIIDGDTIMVKIGEKEESVRLIGIDTPETVDPRKAVQCFGKEASEEMKKLVENKKVRLEVDTTQMDRDKYNRLLRYIYLEDGTLVNKKLIEEGFGFEYTYQIPYKFQTEFKEAQKIAEENKLGMWADGACPTPSVTKAPTPTVKIESQVEPTATKKITEANTNFVCNCGKSCSQITSCEEAYFQLNNCGCTVRDNDGDGVPCESLCR